MNAESPIDVLLAQAARLQAELAPCLDFRIAEQDKRSSISYALGGIAFEHGSGALALIADGKYMSASALLRLQYEALLRSIWLFYCASEGAIEKLSSDEIPRPNERVPSVAEMLSGLSATAPPSLVEPLVEFRDSSWKPLSSLIHGGAPAVSWMQLGFPPGLLAELIRICNGMLVFTCVHLAQLSGNPAHGSHVMECVGRYKSCLPPLREITGES